MRPPRYIATRSYVLRSFLHLSNPKMKSHLSFGSTKQADFCHFMVGTSVASASTLLMIRTIAVWNRSPFIMIPLVVASLGQWVVLLHSIIYMRSSWSDAHKTCVVVAASHVFLGVDFLYSK